MSTKEAVQVVDAAARLQMLPEAELRAYVERLDTATLLRIQTEGMINRALNALVAATAEPLSDGYIRYEERLERIARNEINRRFPPPGEQT